MNILNYIIKFTIIILTVLVVSCNNGNGSDEPSTESLVVTGDAIEINMVSAVVSGKINISKLIGTDYSVGIVYCTQEKYSSTGELSVSNCQYVTAKDIIDNTFTVELSWLQKGEKYYYSAYVYLNGIYYYGKSLTFTTKSITKGYAVDLGLSVKWASINLGSETNEYSSFGNYYYWAEIKKWDESPYPMSDQLMGCGDVRSLIDANIIDDNYHLKAEFDAATVDWGSQWRVPTKEEWQELINKCEWSWSEIDGVKGYLVSGNGNCIFLPGASLQSYNTTIYVDPVAGYGLFLPFTDNDYYIDYPLGFNAFPEVGFYVSASCLENAENWIDPNSQVLGYRFPYILIFGNKAKSIVSDTYSYVIGYNCALSIRPVYCGK